MAFTLENLFALILNQSFSGLIRLKKCLSLINDLAAKSAVKASFQKTNLLFIVRSVRMFCRSADFNFYHQLCGTGCCYNQKGWI
jgi:hypothetical protein